MDLKKFEMKMKTKTKIDPDTGCWLYSGPLNRGHGQITVDYITQYVHRISAAIYLDYDLLSEFQVNHKCSNKNCWNPEHLYIGTQRDNMIDSVIQGNHNFVLPRIYCESGHEITGISDKEQRYCITCRDERMKEYNELYRK